MIGSNLFFLLNKNHDVKVTLRSKISSYQKFGIFNSDNTFDQINILNAAKVEKTINSFSPDVVINAVGITKQNVNNEDEELIMQVNAFFPHILDQFCLKQDCKLIHLSTDCIFSGDEGFYSENDSADAKDLYGKSKYQGEIRSKNSITLRKSTLGLELENKHGLVEWWLSTKGEIKGFRRAIYSGFIIRELSKVIDMILADFPGLSGTWNVASKPINKFDLLCGLQERLNRKDIEIIPDDDFICDRSLDGSAFRNLTGYRTPEWNKMLDSLAIDIEKRDNTINKQ